MDRSSAETIPTGTTPGTWSRLNSGTSMIQETLGSTASPLPAGSESTAQPLDMASRPSARVIINSNTPFGSQAWDEEPDSPEDPYSMPPGRATGMPDGFSSDSEIPKINLAARLKYSIADSREVPNRTAGSSEHLAGDVWVPERPNVYLGSRLEADTEESLGQSPRQKGKGKLTDLNQIQGRGAHYIESSLPQRSPYDRASSQTVICNVLGFPIGEAKTDPKVKAAIKRALSEQTQCLKRDTSRNPGLFDQCFSALEAQREQDRKKVENLRQILECTYAIAHREVQHTNRDDRTLATILAAQELVTIALTEFDWRTKLFTKSHWLMKTQLATPQLATTQQNFQQLLYVDLPEDCFKIWTRVSNVILGKLNEEGHSNTLDASGGLVVMGCNLQTDSQQYNDLTSFVLEFSKQLNNVGGCWMIRHYVGRRTPIPGTTRTDIEVREDLKQYAGVAGLLRSIFHQLILFMRHYINFHVAETFGSEARKKVYQGDTGMLYRLFRELLIEFSAVRERNKIKDHRTIVLVIDAVHILELDQSTLDFHQVVGFLRDLCDETMLGDLGGVLKLQYVFLHNGISKLILQPHPRERIVACETWLAKSSLEKR